MQGFTSFLSLPYSFPLIDYNHHIRKASYFAIGMILGITVYFLINNILYNKNMG